VIGSARFCESQMIPFVPMNPKAPVLDLSIACDGDSWRLHVAASSWVPGLLSVRMDDHGEISPSRDPTPTTLISSCSRRTRPISTDERATEGSRS
jgi:hypothetical protein